MPFAQPIGVPAMRNLCNAFALMASLGSLALADSKAPPIPSSPPVHTVYLSGPAAWDDLRASAPERYARARKIVAAANQICQPGPPQQYFAEFDAHDVACARMMVFTTLPPKRRLSFRLEDTIYVAMVVLEEPKARLVPVP
jgi:hypothetical protein